MPGGRLPPATDQTNDEAPPPDALSVSWRPVPTEASVGLLVLIDMPFVVPTNSEYWRENARPSASCARRMNE